jgi:hypothetical protein
MRAIRQLSAAAALLIIVVGFAQASAAPKGTLPGHVDISTDSAPPGPFQFAEVDAFVAEQFTAVGGFCIEAIEVHIYDFATFDQRVPSRWSFVGYGLRCQKPDASASGGIAHYRLFAYWWSLLGDALKGRINQTMTHAFLEGTLGPANRGTPIDPACEGLDANGDSWFGDQLCPVLALIEIAVDVKWDSDYPPITDFQVHQVVTGQASGSVTFTSLASTRMFSLDGVIGFTDLG